MSSIRTADSHRWRRSACLALALAIASLTGATSSTAQPTPVPGDTVIDPAWNLDQLAAAAAAAAARSQERLMMLLDDVVSPVTQSPFVSRASIAVEFAKRQLGKPYVWGGVGPEAFDCSGLTLQAWRAAGIKIPRTSQQQWHDLTHVRKSDVRPGDLVVYFQDASHIGIYIGDGQIIQAPKPGKVIKRSPIDAMPVLGVVRPE
ncbi:NlpC/P60 family protein [Kitasatospora sp. NPDC086791]|uniref:C40 family peptidase n=1 Tax=Kitasatospora sp. NPDC086791 TaxID=3155178 RepID=UPI0034359409